MRTIRKYLSGFIFTIIIGNYCQSQNIQYANTLRPKVKTRVDSLYPYATGRVVFNDKYVSNTTQEIAINCHCQEATGMIILVFDTNGSFINKDIHYIPVKDVPDTIISYMKKNTSPTVKFLSDVSKSINNKGEISYSIETQESTAWSLTEYTLKFKPSGELISKEIVPPSLQ